MIQAAQKPIPIIPSSRNADAVLAASSLYRRRNAVAVSEDEDARLNGMTRSLDRRLLALNLQPMPPTSEPKLMKVA